MGTAELTIDLNALSVNWKALDALTGPSVETAACVKADAYGLGIERACRALAKAGARRFFVAVAEEGAAIRAVLGDDVQVCVFSGHMRGDTDIIRDLNLVPMLNSLNQVTRHFETLPGHPFGVQIDTGMNRLGMEPAEWSSLAPILLPQNPILVMSHLACADEVEHPMNAAQLATFEQMTNGIGVPRSLAATGGVLLGKDFHFDLTRPGIGLYGGLPFAAGESVVQLSLPVIQIRDVMAGETVGYGNTWVAKRDSKIATVSAGYADGLLRALGSGDVTLYAGDLPCPLVGRVSMDLITVDITGAPGTPTSLDLLTAKQSIDALAEAAGTIGYEILTSLGHRYSRRYIGG